MQSIIELRVEGKPVVLAVSTTMAMEWNNPLFGEEVVPGSFSLPFTIPAAPNAVVFGFPEELSNTEQLGREYSCVVSCDGEELQGLLKLRKVTQISYTVNIQIAISAFGTLLKNRSIRDFEYGGEREMGVGALAALNHMLDTAKHPEEHGYVFAPLFNRSLLDPESPNLEPGLVNRFEFFGSQLYEPGTTEPWYDLDGEPVLSTFHYTTNFLGTSLSMVCPFPKLRHVLESIVQELGATLKDDFFDEELSQLYVLSNAFLLPQAIFENDTRLDRYAFRIAELLPELTVTALLQLLRDTFALSVQVGLDRSVSIRKLKDILSDTAYADLTALATPALERTVEDAEPVTLVYKTDSYAAERVKKFDEKGIKLKDPVQTVADLPSYLEAEDYELRLVLELNQYYMFRSYEDPIGWNFYSDNYMPLKIEGGGSEIEQGITLTPDVQRAIVKDHVTPAITETFLVPGFDLEPTHSLLGETNVEQAFRLAFYRGYQPIKEDAAKQYPMLSSDDVNLQGEQTGNYSLRLDGNSGTYNTFMQEWIDLKVNPKPVTKSLYLDMATLKGLDLNRKVAIAGNRFLIRKIRFSLPLRKPVIFDLLQVKK